MANSAYSGFTDRKARTLFMCNNNNKGHTKYERKRVAEALIIIECF